MVEDLFHLNELIFLAVNFINLDILMITLQIGIKCKQ
jgi:hypothetical protein